MGYIIVFLAFVIISLVIKWKLHKDWEKESIETDKRISVYLEEQREAEKNYF